MKAFRARPIRSQYQSPATTPVNPVETRRLHVPVIASAAGDCRHCHAGGPGRSQHRNRCPPPAPDPARRSAGRSPTSPAPLARHRPARRYGPLHSPRRFNADPETQLRVSHREPDATLRHRFIMGQPISAEHYYPEFYPVLLVSPWILEF